ncbi:MAG: hypothetical protein ACI8WT_002742 [Clostridium sp.]|jgi:hypothetical protein
MYILEIPTQKAKGIVINPNIGKYKAIITANENAAVVCPEGKEYLSIPILLIFKFGIFIKGLNLVTLTFRILPMPVLSVIEIIALIAMVRSVVLSNRKAAVQNINKKEKEPK